MSSVVILTESGMPYGYASSNYVRLLAKGLTEAGAQVKVFIPWHTERQDRPLNNNPIGWVSDGFSFEYSTRKATPPQNVFLRFSEVLGAHRLTCSRLYDLRKNGKLDAVLYYGNHTENHILYNAFCRYLKVPFITFLVEWFPAIPKQNSLRKLYDRLFTYLSMKTPDGLVVISRFLEQKVNAGSLPPACMRMPILIDDEPWRDIRQKPSNKPYVLFCADLNAYLPDVYFIINSVKRLGRNDIDLVLIGDASGHARSLIERYARTSGLWEDLIIHTGYLSDDELRTSYKGAQLLLAPLHDDVRSMARFPSKIGDYLMSGRPVVSNTVGEVSYYLKDKYTAYLCKPDNESIFAETLQYALNDPERDNIGENGRKLAMENFHFKKQGSRLLEFIQSLT
jgi:glycosyltransferase involved in cell wall biosynthesis